MKKYLLLIGFVTISIVVMAQSGTNSPYSMYGIGKLSDQSVGASRGMNGTGIAFREHNEVNPLNPASYSSIDSLAFIFDADMSLQTSNIRENGGSAVNAKNANFEYVTATFRVMKRFGASIGLLPYSNVGYDIEFVSPVIENYMTYPVTQPNVYCNSTYVGDGGVHQVYVGLGYRVYKGLSLGMNASYVWGTVNNYATRMFTDLTINSLAYQYLCDISSYKLDFGLQYSHPIGKGNTATVGLTFTPGHKMNDADLLIISNDTTKATAVNAYSLPTEWGLGFAFKHKQQWKIGVDYKLQKWASIKPSYYVVNQTGKILESTDVYRDRHAVNVGGEYCRNVESRKFFDRLRYRMGVGYSTSYYKLGDVDGPREISVSLGLGIPIVNGYNSRSILNLGFSWQNCRVAQLITENTLLLNIGLTFNERWFAKWKFE